MRAADLEPMPGGVDGALVDGLLRRAPSQRSPGTPTASRPADAADGGHDGVALWCRARLAAPAWAVLDN